MTDCGGLTLKNVLDLYFPRLLCEPAYGHTKVWSGAETADQSTGQPSQTIVSSAKTNFNQKDWSKLKYCKSRRVHKNGDKNSRSDDPPFPHRGLSDRS